MGWRYPWRLDKLRGGNKNNTIGIREPLVCLCVYDPFVINRATFEEVHCVSANIRSKQNL